VKYHGAAQCYNARIVTVTAHSDGISGYNPLFRVIDIMPDSQRSHRALSRSSIIHQKWIRQGAGYELEIGASYRYLLFIAFIEAFSSCDSPNSAFLIALISERSNSRQPHLKERTSGAAAR